ncbi:NifB/NifX family molybdenum-iron cluster-binding protein [Methanolacinia petrolearia]|uniref:NifB/NifX family molybdenum-iron cluster-binding protein n=1 Tax=Methanolacinia petrolearia TaxID=54120 RepID=UPI003BAAEBA3
MKICITSKGTGTDSAVEERFGRAPYFVFVDLESGESSTIENPLLNESGGVGPRIVQLIIKESADVVITGQLGGNATTALQASGVKVYTYGENGTVADAVSKYREGKLRQLI